MELTIVAIQEFCQKLLLHLFGSNELISAVNLVGPLLIAAWVVKRTLPEGTSIFGFLADKSVWSQPSAKLDTIYYFVIQTIAMVLLVPLAIGLATFLSAEMKNGLVALFGPALPGTKTPNTFGETLLYTTVVFIALDFAFFYSHYLSHKLPLLWCLHKVHHSPTVLVPFTAQRFHPLDMLWNMLWGSGFAAMAGAVCQYLFYNGGNMFALFQNNLWMALSYLTFHNLRHSHIWVMFPPRLSRWLISPAQHQLHHSREKRHIDKNMGYLIAVWDRLFGTLYVPVEKEQFRMGVHGMPKTGFHAHMTVRSLLFCPMVEAWQYLTGKMSVAEVMGAAPPKPASATAPLPESQPVAGVTSPAKNS